ncbi:hypothetical protein [Thermincola ferriacetica]
MGKTLKYLKTYRGILEELLRVQKELEAAEAEGNEILARLFELDTVRLRERLKINPCEICYYGYLTVAPSHCELWDKCRSTVKLERMWDDGDWVNGEFSLQFKLQN